MDPVRIIKGRMVPLPNQNVDTDSVTPARFLKITNKDQSRLANAFFHDWRFDANDNPKPDFVLNKPEYQGAPILLAGDNFGTGSSREHAVWATKAFGFRAVVSTSIADIYRSNSLKNGLLPVVVDKQTHEELFALAAKDPNAEVTIDLEKQTISWGAGKSTTFPIDEFSKKCLLQGVDQLGYIRSFDAMIGEFEKKHLPPVTSYK